jgi:putative membrane protein
MESVMRFKTASAVALLLVSSPVAAQFGNPGGMAPGSADAGITGATAKTNTTDQLFARLVAAGGTGEVELARLTQRKTRNPRVKAFADQMVADHAQANTKLSGLANQAGLRLPRGIDPDQARVRADLESLDADLFDIRYMDAQVTDHQKTTELLTWEIGQGQNAPLQRFAIDTLPTVLHHLEMAKDLAMQLRTTAPNARAASLPGKERR